jgi:hypothetical protein
LWNATPVHFVATELPLTAVVSYSLLSSVLMIGPELLWLLSTTAQ